MAFCQFRTKMSAPVAGMGAVMHQLTTLFRRIWLRCFFGSMARCRDAAARKGRAPVLHRLFIAALCESVGWSVSRRLILSRWAAFVVMKGDLPEGKASAFRGADPRAYG